MHIHGIKEFHGITEIQYSPQAARRRGDTSNSMAIFDKDQYSAEEQSRIEILQHTLIKRCYIHLFIGET